MGDSSVPVRYPWDLWFQRTQLKLVQGRDYSCMPHSMGQQIRNEACDRGVKVSIYINGGILTVILKGDSGAS